MTKKTKTSKRFKTGDVTYLMVGGYSVEVYVPSTAKHSVPYSAGYNDWYGYPSYAAKRMCRDVFEPTFRAWTGFTLPEVGYNDSVLLKLTATDDTLILEEIEWASGYDD